MEWKDWIILAPAIVQTIYAALTFHRDFKATGGTRRTRRPIFIVVGFTLLTWAAVALDYF